MMSNQEGQFMPPDKDSSSQDFMARPINAQDREQEQWQHTPGYQAEKIQPRQAKRHVPAGCLISGIVGVVMLVALGGRFGSHNFMPSRPIPIFHDGPRMVDSTRLFTTGTHPTLIIHDQYGSIHIHAQQGNTVQAQATQSAGPEAQIQYDQSKDQNTVTITVNPGNKSNFFDANGVDLEVNVPATTDLQLDTNAGDIQVNDVQGQMQLSSNAGTIEARDTILTGTSTLKTDAGDVTFSGNIDTNGTYQLSSNAGSVHITLPQNSGFHVDAKTDLGSINSSFSAIKVQDNQPGAEAHGDVGNTQQAKVTLQTNDGSIDINSNS